MKKLTKKTYVRKSSREELERMAVEILELAGRRYSRGGALKRWGANPGSVFVGDQKLKIAASFFWKPGGQVVSGLLSSLKAPSGLCRLQT